METAKRILCVGDSNTWGWDPRSYTGSRYGPDIRWTDRLSREEWRVLNDGQNGRAVPREREFPGIEDALRRYAPLDAVAVMLGSNDLLEGRSPAETAGRMEEFLLFLRERLEDAALLLIAPPPFRPGEWGADDALIRESEALAREYRALAERLGLPFADAGEWGAELCFDGVHFSPEGHAAFARGLAKRLEELF